MTMLLLKLLLTGFALWIIWNIYNTHLRRHRGYHWTGPDERLNHDDNRQVVEGQTLSVQGYVLICHSGLHACEHPGNALYYARLQLDVPLEELILWEVEVWGSYRKERDKFVGRHRKAVKRIGNAGELLRYEEYTSLDTVKKLIQRFLENQK